MAEAFTSAERKSISSHFRGPDLHAKIQSHANSARAFLQGKNYNNQICFLVDMSLPSSAKRFFIYDLDDDHILNSGLVAHGTGSETGSDDLYFSNVPGSNCTSTGKYRIGYSYYGTFGLAFKLHGLDTSNSNAFERFVVLHAHKCVPDDEPGEKICKSWGCPTVSPAFLQTLKVYIEKSDKPVLLWIYN